MVHFRKGENPQTGGGKTVADILTAAADLIEPEGAWTQGAFGRNAAGEDTGLGEYKGPAVCWCLLGATDRVASDDSEEADTFLSSVLGCDVGVWNDAPERTQAEVVAALREAARVADSLSDRTVGTEPKAECTKQPPLSDHKEETDHD